jgi:hypothetical protein
MYWTAVATAVSRTPVTLTREERIAKANKHKFGLCPACDKGLDDRVDFIVVNSTTKPTGFSLFCAPCYYHQNLQSPIIQPFN